MLEVYSNSKKASIWQMARELTGDMKNVLTFVIPVRHPKNARNWARVKRNLSETVLSISRQQSAGWKAVIVANHGAELPDIPTGFEVKRVDFSPNQFICRKKKAEKEAFYDAIRIDKGRRILAGMLHAGEMGHVMIVDDDDFVSSTLVNFRRCKSSGKRLVYPRWLYLERWRSTIVSLC